MEMNRAMRRAIKNSKPVPDGKVIPLPVDFDEETVFDIPQRIFKLLKSGDIEAINGTPIFFDMYDDACEVVPAMLGWVYTWEQINEGLALGLNLRPIKKVSNRLQAAMWLSPSDVDNAKVALDAIRHVFRRTNIGAIKRIAMKAQIAILMKDHHE